MTAPAVLELPLDDTLLKVLSSESRREIMRLLAERRMTGAELATRLDLGKPAVSEHLKKLLEAGLIDRFDDPERRWVYYSLSSRGRSILEPQRVRFYLVLAVAALALMLGMALALGLVAWLEKDAASTLADGSDPSGGGFGAGLGGLPGRDDGSPVTVPSTGTKAPATTAPEPERPREVLVYTGPTRAAAGAANGTGNASAPVTQSFTLVLKDGKPLPLEFLTRGGVVMMRPQDIDAANGTATVELVALANGTVPQGLGNATAIDTDSTAPVLLPLLPGATPMLQVVAAPAAATPDPTTPDPPVVDGTVDPPPTGTGDSGTGSTSTASAPATTASPPAGTTASTATGTVAPPSDPPASSGPAPSGNPHSPAAGNSQQPPVQVDVATTAVPPSDGPATSLPPADAATSTAAAPALGAGRGAETADGVAAQVPPAARQPTDTFPLPFVALIAAAIVAGVLRPLRKD